MPSRIPGNAHGLGALARTFRAGAALTLAWTAVFATARAGDLLRGGAGPKAAADQPASTTATPVAAATQAVTAPQDRLARTTQALEAVRKMQTDARAVALKAGAANARANLPQVVDGLRLPTVKFSLNQTGLKVAPGVPTDLKAPKPTENAKLWVGAELPTVDAKDPNQITIKQTEQQAILNWETFSIGTNTTLTFDQKAGGPDVGQWIAFNRVGTIGSPSQILGSIKADGQVYVINPNGIIFGGTSQISAHTFVASSLPINDNLIARGLLNNPDGQFLFAGLNQAAGSKGPTDTFTPLMGETKSVVTSSTATTVSSSVQVMDTKSVTVTYPGSTPLVLGTDYTVDRKTSDGTATVTFTPVGAAKVGSGEVGLAYTPAPSAYGDVTVLPGAQLYSPTTAEHVGGRIQLVGPNVTNGGTISAPDGQVILAAGLEVGVAAHSQNDPSLRGLDVYVGRVDVTDTNTPKGYTAGTAKNARTIDATTGIAIQGLIETTDFFAKNADGSAAPPLDVPGAVTMVGKRVDQLGVIASASTVSFNGRIDLLAEYNAIPNDSFDPLTDVSRPFYYKPTSGTPTTGILTLGAGSLLRIRPSDSLTDKINRTQEEGLALKSKITLRSQAIHFASDVLDSISTIPDTAQVATLFAPSADATLDAGSWRLDETSNPLVSTFLYSTGQVYMDRGTVIDVSGTKDAKASVTENIVDVQLRGAELADAPLQRNNPALRGQTVQVDSRVHGPWDPTLNDGKGGYAWVGTPLADAQGWVNLVQRTAGELTTKGGTVSIRAGGSVVLQPSSTIDVSGGWISYQAGQIQTTKLLSGGHVYDISQATNDRVYDAIYNGSTTVIDPKWGVSETTSKQVQLSSFDPGYLQGGSGGKLSLQAASVALDGDFLGRTTSGTRQLLTTPTAGSFDFVTRPSSFSLVFGSQLLDPANKRALDYSPLPPNVVFQASAGLAKDAPVPSFLEDSTGAYTLSKQRQDEVDLSPSLISLSGFGFIKVDASDDNFGSNGRKNNSGDFGRITIPVAAGGAAQSTLAFSGASALAEYINKTDPLYAAQKIAALELKGANVDILGRVTAPGSNLSFVAKNISYSNDFVKGSQFPPGSTAIRDTSIIKPDPRRGNVTLAATGALSTAGEVIDYRSITAVETPVVDIAGGQVTLEGYKTTLVDGSTIDVSGGATVSGVGKVGWGSAGRVTLNAKNEQAFDGAKLTLGTTYTGTGTGSYAMRGYGGIAGGSYAIEAPLLQIGGEAETKGTLLLDPRLFSLGGFATFDFTGVAASSFPAIEPLIIGSRDTALVPTGTTAPVAVSISPIVSGFQANLAKRGSAILQTYVPDEPFRSPVKLSFTALGYTKPLSTPLAAAITFGSNATIKLTPNASSEVKFNGDTVAILGQVVAPGGKISVAGSKNTLIDPFNVSANPLATVYLGPKAVLSTAGAPLVSLDSRGFTVGSILDGGEIKLSGNIVAEGAAYNVNGKLLAPGAKLDASGSSGVLDVTPFESSLTADAAGSTAGSARVRMTVDSNGGKITLAGAQMLVSDATLVAKSGGSSALGGTLSIDSGLFLINGGTPDPATASLFLTSTGNVLPSSFYADGKTAIGKPVLDAKGKPLSSEAGQNLGGGFIAASSFRSGGFDFLNFGGTVKFSDAVSLNAGSEIAIGASGMLLADTSLTSSWLSLTAPRVVLGTPYVSPGQSAPFTTDLSPKFGNGTVTVNAGKLIDVGNLSLRGVGSTILKTLPNGDVRGYGTLDVAGDLSVTAGQINPASATTFTLAAYDYVSPTDQSTVKGTITLGRTGSPQQVPLSAGGTLNVFASTIDQGGVLRAPLGRINLGGGSAANQADPFTQQGFAESVDVTLLSGSVASVSTLDLDGKPLATAIPYGVNLNGSAWIDPTGADITLTGPTGKGVLVSAQSVDDNLGSQIDISGGGDLYAYRFVSGVNGKTDVLGANSTSFAVIPGYSAPYAPLASFNTTSSTDSFTGDKGYVTSDAKYRVGDSVYLDLGDGKGPKTYTLLPARYALLDGAYLITPKATLTPGTVKQADGSTLVAGYRYNVLDSNRALRPLFATWEVAPTKVIRARAQYDDSFANDFFTKGAAAREVTAPRLPVDAGQLVLSVQESLTLAGKVNARPQLKADGTALGRGGLVDVATPQDILISGPNTDLTDTGSKLVLAAGDLNGFGAESLLIGGTRKANTEGGFDVTVTTDNVIVDNGPSVDTNGKVIKAGVALKGTDIVLVANQNVLVATNGDIEQTGKLAGAADALTLVGAKGGVTKLVAGKTYSLIQAGTPLVFPDGTASNSLKATVAGVITFADPTVLPQTFKAGEKIQLPALATVTLNATGDISVVAGTSSSTATTSVVSVNVQTGGDGALLRVTGDPAARVTRTGMKLADLSGAFVSDGATVTGGTGSLTLDSTGTTFVGKAYLGGKSLNFGSKGISVVFDQPPTDDGNFVFPSAALPGLQKAGTTALSLLSYSSIDTYGTGVLGAADTTVGTPALDSLTLRAAQFRNQTPDGAATFQASTIALGVTSGSGSRTAPLSASGKLAFNAAKVLTVGTKDSKDASQTTRIDGFDTATLGAGEGVLFQGSGALSVDDVGATFVIDAPLLTAMGGSSYSLSSGGAVKLVSSGTSSGTVQSGLGSSLAITGTSVTANNRIYLPSGSLTLHATDGNVSIGGSLDVSGQAKRFNDLVKYSGGGSIFLTADDGEVSLGQTGQIDVSAALDVLKDDGKSRVGNAGMLNVSAIDATAGKFVVGGKIQGFGGFISSQDIGYTPGRGGSFALDVGSVPDLSTDPKVHNPSLRPLSEVLNAGGFNQSRAVRVRTGDVVVDGTASAHEYSLSADTGSILVRGTIDASGDQAGTVDLAGKPTDAFGNHGGTITLSAGQSVVLEKDAKLSVAAADFNSAGKGGAISLEAGSSVDGVAPAKKISRDSNGKLVWVDALPAGQATPVIPMVDIQAGSTIDLSVAASTVSLAAGAKYTMFLGTRVGDLLASDTDGVITTAQGQTIAFKAGILPAIEPGGTITLNAAGKLNFLIDSSRGTATGTLHLRAPQAVALTDNSGPKPVTLAPDVQINPIDGTLVNPSSVVVEGYRMYAPNGGYIDAIEADVDANGRVFASAKNSQNIAAALTQRWSTGPNAGLSAKLGEQLHIRPGAEVVALNGTVTPSALTFTTVGANSKVDAAVGATLVLPNTTGSTVTPLTNTNQLVFTSSVKLTANEAGSYFYARTLTTADTLGLPVTPTTSLSAATSAIPANRLVSDVDFKVTTSNGTVTTFTKGSQATIAVPALAVGSTVTFSSAGTVKLSGTTSVAMRVTEAFSAGVAVTTPPVSTTVNLTTKGGKVTFIAAGTMTYQSRTNALNTLVVQAPVDGSITTGTNSATLLAGNNTSFRLDKTTSSFVDATSGTRIDLPLGLSGATLAVDASGTTPATSFNIALNPTQGGTLVLTQGGTITLGKGGAVTLSTIVDSTVGTSLSSTATLKASASGGTTIVSTANGSATRNVTIDSSTGIAFTATGGTLTLGVDVVDNQLTTTVPLSQLASDGSLVKTFQVGDKLPAFRSGTTFRVDAAGSISTTSTASVAIVVKNPIQAGVSTAIADGSVIALSTAGTIKASSASFNGTLVDTFAAGTPLSLVGTDKVTLPASAENLQIATKGRVTITGTGALSLTSDTQTKLAMTALPANTLGATVVLSPNSSVTASGVTMKTGALGDLTLAGTWDLSTYRYGPNVNPNKPGSGEPGILTLRAAGNLIFNYSLPTSKVLAAGSLSDGFGPVPATTGGGLWQAPLLPAGSQSWTYQLIAGADTKAANVRAVVPLTSLNAKSGSVQLGLNATNLFTSSSNPSTATLIPQYYQTIRTGTGAISIYAGRDVQLLNQLATIYTAGAQVDRPTSLLSTSDFDLPTTYYKSSSSVGTPQNFSTTSPYPTQYTYGGGDVTVVAGNDIAHLTHLGADDVADSAKEMPTNWLYRRGYVNSATGEFGAIQTQTNGRSEVASTSWWVDFSNFFEGVGALGGGNVKLTAGRDVANVDAVAPTNGRVTKQILSANASVDKVAAHQILTELGGGDVTVSAGRNIDGGVYYVERGAGDLKAGAGIKTNSTRTTLTAADLVQLNNAAPGAVPNAVTWLPTTLFLGKGNFDVSASGDVLLGSVANPFLLPEGVNNSYLQRTFFSTYSYRSSLTVSSLRGDIDLKGGSSSGSRVGTLFEWYQNVLSKGNGSIAKLSANSQPWLRLSEATASGSLVEANFSTATIVYPGTVKLTALTGKIGLTNDVMLAPSPSGMLDLIAAGSVTGVQPIGLKDSRAPYSPDNNDYNWGSSTLLVSDADPKRVPGVLAPEGYQTSVATITPVTPAAVLSSYNGLFADSGATAGQNVVLQTQQALHGKRPDDTAGAESHALHGGDYDPVHVYSDTGDLSGLTLFSPKSARILAGNDISNVGLFLQNVRTTDVTVVASGRDIAAYNPNDASLAKAASKSSTPIYPLSGDIQISGPGSLQVYAGRNIDLGSPLAQPDRSGLSVGITSVGNSRNSYLPFDGADIVLGSGVKLTGPSASAMDFAGFINRYLNPVGGTTAAPTSNALAARYLPEMGKLLNLAPTASADAIWTAFQALDASSASSDLGLQRSEQAVLDVFFSVLRDAGRDHNDPDKAGFGNYDEGKKAIETLFPGKDAAGKYAWQRTGDIALSSREIRTTNGGDITLFAPGGGLSLGKDTQPKSDRPPPGIITEHGGNISTFTRDNVDLGVSRIFTLRGGNEVIWSELGNIAAGVSSKTIQSAPPTRVLIDPQSANVKTDLAGLATGGGIGVLATLAGVAPGNVDLIAPTGTVDAGDAGIRSSGRVNIAALHVVNASNIQAAGPVTGTPPPPTPPNVGGLTSAANAGGASNSAAADIAKQQQSSNTNVVELPSLISVEVIGYGGGEGDDSQLDKAPNEANEGNVVQGNDESSDNTTGSADSDGERRKRRRKE